MEEESTAGRNDSTEPSAIHNAEHRQTAQTPELAPGLCGRSAGSPQRTHTEPESDVSDTDQELDIEEDDGFTLDPQF